MGYLNPAPRTTMTTQEGIEKLNGLSRPMEPEDVHWDADEILLAVLRSNGLSEVADAWDACRDRVGFWYC